MEIHICSITEYDANTRVPTIVNPNSSTFYLVPTVDGTSPDLFTEWVYVNNAWEMFGSASVDLTDYIKNTDYATGAKAGVIKLNPNYGINVTDDGILYINTAESKNAKMGTNNARPITPIIQHESIFYGLAKASGTDEKDSTLPVGQYTDEAKSSIQDMLDVPSNSELKEINDSKADVIVESVSGDIVSFDDGADDMPLKSLVVDINPVQDLHGQESPYPAGGSANIWGIMYPVSTERGATVVERADGTFFVSCDVALGRLNYLLNVEANEAYTIKCELSDVTGNATQASIITVYDGEDETATILLNGVSSSASPKNFTPSGDKVYLKFNVTGGNAGGTAVIGKPTVIKGSYNTTPPYSPYENICPISGWTGANVYNDPLYGGNVEWNQRVDFSRIASSHNGVQCIVESDGTLSFSGEITTSYRSFYTAQHVISGHRYLERLIIVANPNNMAFRFHVFQSGSMPIYTSAYNKSMITTAQRSDAIGMGIEGFTAGDVLDGIKIKVGLFDLTQMFGETVADYIYSLEVANEGAGVAWFDNLFPNDYYPYNIGEKTTVSAVNSKPYTYVNIPLGQTVYGAHIDVLSGKLTIDRAMVDLGTLNWTYDASRERFRGFLPTTSSASTSNPEARTHCLCSIYKTSTVAYNDANRTFMVVCVNTDYVWLRDNRFTDAATFKVAMSGVQLCYELATPIEIQLSANQINSIYGVNNIWADTGTTSVEYCADTEMYIEKVKPVVNVDDVQINGTSIVTYGVANVPIMSSNGFGVAKVSSSYGTNVNGNGQIIIAGGGINDVKAGTSSYKPVVPARQHESTFYGLAKASGDTTQSASSNAVGNYTEEAKTSIQNMLGITDKYSPKEWIAESETELVTNAHNIGDLFYIGETLYKVIADLNAGDAINVGVNVEEVDVNNILTDYATKEDVQDNVSIVEKSASGAIASFADGADDIPLKSLIVNIDPVQSGSGDPSPENLCPISGWTQVNVNHSGVNLFDKATAVTGYVDDLSGQLKTQGAGQYSKSTDYISVKPNASYYISSEQTKGSWGAWYDKDKNYISGITGYIATASDVQKTKTAPSNAYYMRLTVEYYISDTVYGNVDTFSINYPSTDHDYHPYTGRSITIDLGQTVYGAKLYPLEGKALINMAMVDMGTLNWVSEDSTVSGLARTDVRNIGVIYYSAPICSKFRGVMPKSYVSIGESEICFSNSETYPLLRVKWSGLSGKTDVEIKTALTGVQLCYELAEPIEIQLSANQINSLYGVNNLWASSGDTSVEYFSQVDKDLIDYIETSLKPYAKEERLNDYVSDVQVNGNSIVENNVANVPIATQNVIGALYTASEADGKVGTHTYRAIVPKVQHSSVFYGLAKAAGDVTQSSSTNAVGTYTDEAKTAIKQMLGIHDTIDSFVEEVSGTDVTITGQPSYRYNCGELYSLTVTPPSSGTIDIRFTSGSTPTVLTLPQTVKMPEWWVEVEANTIYEMCITDGIYCGVMTWAI